MKNKEDAIGNFGIYKTWVVSKELPHEKNCLIYFPDFPEAEAFKIKQAVLPEKRGQIIHGVLNHYITGRIKSKEGVDKAMPEETVIEYYGEGGLTLKSNYMWNFIDKVYPPEMDINEIPLPRLKDLFKPKPLDLDFWVIINNVPNEWEPIKHITKKYEIIFPEINVHDHIPLYAADPSELLQKIDEKLLKKLETHIADAHQHPKKWSSDEIMADYEHADTIKIRSISTDDYLDILRHRNLKKEPLHRVYRYQNHNNPQ